MERVEIINKFTNEEGGFKVYKDNASILLYDENDNKIEIGQPVWIAWSTEEQYSDGIIVDYPYYIRDITDSHVVADYPKAYISFYGNTCQTTNICIEYDTIFSIIIRKPSDVEKRNQAEE